MKKHVNKLYVVTFFISMMTATIALELQDIIYKTRIFVSSRNKVLGKCIGNRFLPIIYQRKDNLRIQKKQNIPKSDMQI